MTGESRVRVTFVVPDLGVGGAERHVATLVEHLDPTRFEARVICIGREGELFADVAAWAPATAFGHGKRQVLASIRALVRELRRTRPDVLVLRGYNAELIGRVAAVVARVPRTVVWVHNCDDLEPRGRVRELSDRLLEPATDAYFGVAERQVPYLTEDLGHPLRKVRIIHNGVDPSLFSRPEDEAARAEVRAELGFGDDDVVVGILAALRPEKDHELFLEAARRVLEQVPDARFVVAGDGTRRPQLEELAGQLGLGDRVVFTGYRSDVPRLLAAIDVFVLASYTIECFPMSLLEAMAASRPAVCTAVGGVPEMIEEGVTGHLVPPKDAGPLSERLVELVRDPQRREALGRGARERVERLFTLERSVREAERCLAEVVEGRSTQVSAAAGRPIGLTVVMDETAVGGAELVTLRMFEAMDRDVVRPRVAVLRSAGPLDDDFRAAGVEVDVLERSGKFDVRTLPRLVRALRRADTEAVLMSHHHRASLVLGRVAARLAGVKVSLVAAHDMDLVPLGQRVLPTSTVATLGDVSALVLLAPSQGDYLHDHEGVGATTRSRTREVVIPNGIRIEALPGAAERARGRALLGLDDDEFVIGIVARLSAQKAHQVLFAAFAELLPTHPGARLVVVGTGVREDELHGLVTELGIADRVLFTGLRRDVHELIPAFDVTALSSVHEAAPIIVLESMAAGVPVVATDCGALRDMFEDGREGLLVPVGDSSRLAAALAALADDPALRDGMGQAARRRAEADFDITRTARGYESLLQQLVVRR